ncbi:proton myo-inositol cotransporter-like [Hydractinia symbiolongicarpus]|uniref:proton myo-inositol cotransporter-like n=1 Tax=Hydractinia symbiolongicarpus TaxID=13093 RepID=UPI0025512DAA|nr:proton myo-inositol cotransporter-like [Hydractinia symbiolongicarpus]
MADSFAKEDQIISDDEDVNEKTKILSVNVHAYKQSASCYVYMLSLFAALGGFLFGYDTGVISGAMIPLKKHFDLSNELQEAVVSITVGGAILGSLTAGFVSQKFGRRPVLLIASFGCSIGAVITGIAGIIWVLLLGRFVVGLGIGYASATVPVYIAEAAPAHKRGQLVTVNQLFITLGFLLANVVNAAFTYVKEESWRFMLGVAGIPSIIMFFGFLCMPESPRWLISQGRTDEAKKVLSNLMKKNVSQEIEDISKAISLSRRRSADSRNIFVRVFKTQTTRRAVLVGCGLQAFQQFCGINTVMYYSATIIEMAGVSDQTQIIWLAAAVASSNFLFTLISIMFIEKVGRRKLTLASMLGVTVALCLLAGTFILLKSDSPKSTFQGPSKYTQGCASYNQCFSCVQDKSCGFCFTQRDTEFLNGICLSIDAKNDNHRSKFCNHSNFYPSKVSLSWSENVCPTSYAWLAVTAMIFYLAIFAPGLGPMPWAINAEIYPLWARSFGTSASTATNWFCNLLVSLTFLNIMDWLTRPGAFFLYACITLLGFIFLAVFLPETKGKKLEEVEELFSR